MDHHHRRRNHCLWNWTECFVFQDRCWSYSVGIDTVGTVAGPVVGPVVGFAVLVLMLTLGQILELVRVATSQSMTNTPESAAWVPLVVGVLTLLIQSRCCCIVYGERCDHRHC
jgi:hypothetical protein